MEKEAKMLERSRHPKIVEFLRVCSKPLASMTEYECFDFTLFGIDHQVSDLLKFLLCLDRLKTLNTDAFGHFLPMLFSKGARDVAEGLSFLHANDIVFGETDICEKGIKNKT